MVEAVVELVKVSVGVCVWGRERENVCVSDCAVVFVCACLVMCLCVCFVWLVV